MCVNPISLQKGKYIVPCGKCGNCIKRIISDYGCRCLMEHRYSQRSFFVTLTYAELPDQLHKQELQLFFKRLRKRGYEFSYFALGDYGDTFGRPHYHVLFFVKGFFEPSFLSDLWGNGFVDCKPMSSGRIFYVVRYGFLAKLDWDKRDKRQKPFFLMSRRPALGLAYLGQKRLLSRPDPLTGKDREYVRFDGPKAVWHRKADIWYFASGPFKHPLPRYYRDKLFDTLARLRHSNEYWEASDKKLRERLEVIARTNDNPLQTYYERNAANADNYLKGLREQKRFKNKTL